MAMYGCKLAVQESSWQLSWYTNWKNTVSLLSAASKFTRELEKLMFQVSNSQTNPLERIYAKIREHCKAHCKAPCRPFCDVHISTPQPAATSSPLQADLFEDVTCHGCKSCSLTTKNHKGILNVKSLETLDPGKSFAHRTAERHCGIADQLLGWDSADPVDISWLTLSLSNWIKRSMSLWHKRKNSYSMLVWFRISGPEQTWFNCLRWSCQVRKNICLCQLRVRCHLCHGNQHCKLAFLWSLEGVSEWIL